MTGFGRLRRRDTRAAPVRIAERSAVLECQASPVAHQYRAGIDVALVPEWQHRVGIEKEQPVRQLDGQGGSLHQHLAVDLEVGGPALSALLLLRADDVGAVAGA